MINTCNDYAKKHNLTFSTNKNLAKCKTKCVKILRKERPVRNLKLGDDELPWVKTFTHLGCKIEDKLDGMKKDIREKRARFIQKNNEICQEFNFAHPKTKVKLNWIYNSHFTGSPIWDLFCKEADMISSTWNVATRIMFGLDRKTHRYFIEPLGSRQHIKWALIQRYINFTKKLQESSKLQLNNLYQKINKDCRSTTGRNIRRIENLFNGKSFKEIDNDQIKKKEFFPIKEEDKWRLSITKELTDVKFNLLSLEGFTRSQIKDMLLDICTT